MKMYIHISVCIITIVEDEDYTNFPTREIVFRPQGAKSQSVGLDIVNDERSEPTENLVIQIKPTIPQGGEGTISPPINISITIIDDDTSKCAVCIRVYSTVIAFTGLHLLSSGAEYKYCNTCM